MFGAFKAKGACVGGDAWVSEGSSGKKGRNIRKGLV